MKKYVLVITLAVLIGSVGAASGEVAVFNDEIKKEISVAVTNGNASSLYNRALAKAKETGYVEAYAWLELAQIFETNENRYNQIISLRNLVVQSMDIDQFGQAKRLATWIRIGVRQPMEE